MPLALAVRISTVQVIFRFKLQSMSIDDFRVELHEGTTFPIASLYLYRWLSEYLYSGEACQPPPLPSDEGQRHQ